MWVREPAVGMAPRSTLSFAALVAALCALLVGAAAWPAPVRLGGAAAAAPKMKCSACKAAVVGLEKYLEKNTTQTKIAAELTKECWRTKELSAACYALVKEGLPKAAAYLEEKVTPDEVCGATGACAKSGVPSELEVLGLRAADAQRGGDLLLADGKAPDTCSKCKLLVAEVGVYLANNATEDKVIAMAEKSCGELGAALAPMCTKLVDAYGPEAYAYAKKEVADPAALCTKIGECKKLELATGKPFGKKAWKKAAAVNA